MSRRHRSLALSCLFASAVPLAAFIETAEARRYGSMFSAGRSAGSAGRAAARAPRTAEETARLKQVESRIDWSEFAKKGLEVVKTAIEKGKDLSTSSTSSTSSGSATAFGATTLNVIELEACVRESKWLDDADVVFQAGAAKLNAESARIDRMGADIDAARANLNRSSQRAVDAFNARIREHKSAVDHYNNVMLAGSRREQEAFNGRVGQFNQYCNGKRYYDGDLAEVETKIGFKLGQ